MNKLGIILVFCYLTTSCGGGACTDSIEPGIILTVYDATTGNNLCGVSGMAIDDDYIENIEISGDTDCNSSRFIGAWERPGEYQIVLEKVGYETWSSDTIVISRNSCHVNTQTISVYMQEVISMSPFGK